MNNKTKAQALVETALILPLLLMMVFVFLDLGRAVYYYSALENGVREGARYASVHREPTEAEIDAIVLQYSVGVKLLDSDVNPPVYSGTYNEYVTVSAVYEFTPITPFLAQILGAGNTIPLDSSSTMMLAPAARTD